MSARDATDAAVVSVLCICYCREQLREQCILTRTNWCAAAKCQPPHQTKTTFYARQ